MARKGDAHTSAHSEGRLQAAMEYLVTYGWAILILAIVVGVLWYVGVFSNLSGSSSTCIGASDYLCGAPVLASNGLISVTMEQLGTTAPTITGMGCSNSSAQPSKFSTPSISSFPYLKTTSVSFTCNLPATTVLGTPFSGTLWIQYSQGGQTSISEVGTVQTHVQVISPVIITTPVLAFSSTGTYAWTQSSNSLDGNAYVNPSDCVVASGYIYCMGATSGGGSPTVTYAQALSNGDTSPWTESANTLSPLYLNSCVTANGYIYCMGGSSGGSSTVQYAQILSNGGTTVWQTTNTLATSTWGASCVTVYGYIYCMGDDTGNSQAVQSAQVLNGAGTSTWTNINGLVDGEAGASCVVTTTGYIYCTGGSSTPAVQYAQASAGGAISSWQTTNALNNAVWGTSCTTYNSYIWCMGGQGLQTSVQYAKILSGGGTTTWTSQATNTLAVGDQYFGCVAASNYIDCMGGESSGDTLAVVQYALS